MSTVSGAEVFAFEGFSLDSRQRRLFGPDGRSLPLSGRAFDTLLYLVEHPNQLIDKQALMKAVWPNVVVEENNLNQNILIVRRALGETPGDNRFIVTVAGRGFRFVSAVRRLEGAGAFASDTKAASKATEASAAAPIGANANGPAARDESTSSTAPTAAPVREVREETAPSSAVSAVRGDRASIAVLPFASLSSDPEKDYFGDGIAEELIHLLARVPGLKVPARTSSFAYKGRNTDVRQIACELGVAMVLEGSVRSAGDRIRVTAQLIEADSGYHLWSHSYDRRFADVFELQDELAAAIVGALRLNLGETAGRPLREAQPTKSVEAYRLYLQARSLTGIDRGSPVLSLLEESIALDPEFARAHAALGVVRNWQFLLGLEGTDVLVEARRLAERAISLDPDTPEAHVVIGQQQAGRGEWLDAETSLLRALKLDPREAHTYQIYAFSVLGCVGKLKQALAESYTAYDLAPANAGCVGTFAGFSGLNDRNDDFVHFTQLACDLGAQGNYLELFRSEAARRSGHYAQAGEHCLGVLPTELRSPGADDLVRLIYKALAEPQYASDAVASLRTLTAKADPLIIENWPMMIMVLLWYELLGARDDAYDTVQRMVRAFKRTGLLNVTNLTPLWLTELRAFRTDARFQSLVRDLGFFDYWKSRGAPDGYELRGERLVPL